MNCADPSRVDLSELGRGGGDAAGRPVHEHYARCPQCAADVHSWTIAHESLSTADAPHPPPKKLLWFGERPQSLPADARAAIARHLGTCAACRDELTTLAGIDLHALTRPLAGIATTIPVTIPPPPPPRRAWIGPGTPFALIGLGLLPLIFTYVHPTPPVRPVTPPRLAAPSQPNDNVAETAARVVGAAAQSPHTAKPKAAPPTPIPVAGTPPPGAHLPDRPTSAGEATPSTRGPTQLPAPADAAPDTEIPPPPDGPTVHLRPSGSVRVAASDQGNVFLVAPTHPAAASAAGADIRIVETSQRRELHQAGRVDGSTVSTQVAGSWLAPGNYQIEVNVAGVLTVYRLTVTR